MIQLILMASLMQVNPSSKQTAQFQPCVWPNKCAAQTVAQFQPCVWPNKCATKTVAQFQPCVWPNKCANVANG